VEITRKVAAVNDQRHRNNEFDAEIVGLNGALEHHRRPPAFSDEALALRFAEQCGDLRYCAAWSRWLAYGGACWQFDDTLLAFDRARRICRHVVAEANDKIAKAIASAKTVAAVVTLARADRRLAGVVDQWDADPWLLNTPLGVVDLRTGKCRPPRSDDYLTKLTGVAPNASCPIPIWVKFLNRVSAGDAQLIAFLQRVAGYSLTLRPRMPDGATRGRAIRKSKRPNDWESWSMSMKYSSRWKHLRALCVASTSGLRRGARAIFRCVESLTRK
jgi:D5 N terminal like